MTVPDDVWRRVRDMDEAPGFVALTEMRYQRGESR